MSEQMETAQARLLKLARIEEMAVAVEKRLKLRGSLSLIADDVRELLSEIRRPAVSVGKPRKAQENNSQRTS
jgi:hypothetical protein